MSYRLSRLTKIFAAAGAVAVMSAGTAQAADPETAQVPFVVNVNAQVSATSAEGVTETMSVTAGEEKILTLTLPHDPTSIKTRGLQDSRPAITTVSRGKIMLNLPAQSYQHADISLYTINGKLVTRGKASAGDAVRNISRSAVASGLYLLSVKGTDGSTFTSRVPHQGGTMDINVSFGGGASLKKSAATTFPYDITVSAAGYANFAYTLNVTAGANEKQTITLEAVTYTITFDANGGTVTPTSGTTGAGGLLTSPLPTPTREGYTFNGWFTAATNVPELKVETTTVFTADATIYARWDFTGYTITFDPRGGTVTPASAQTGLDGKLTWLPNLPYIEGTTFLGWHSAAANPKELVTRNTVFTANTTIYASTINGPATLYDDRDGKPFRILVIPSSGKVWMAENLNYAGPNNDLGECYGNDDANCAKYGRLYTWEEMMAGASSSSANPSGVQGICPDGWHVPSIAEWSDLIKQIDPAYTSDYHQTAGSKLKSRTGWEPYEGISSTDEYGFSAMPGGYRHDDFQHAGGVGYWWGATAASETSAQLLMMYYNMNTLNVTSLTKGNRLSVRCVRGD